MTSDAADCDWTLLLASTVVRVLLLISGGLVPCAIAHTCLDHVTRSECVVLGCNCIKQDCDSHCALHRTGRNHDAEARYSLAVNHLSVD
jgi:hypothetical protein